MHIKRHLGVNFMINYFSLLGCCRAGARPGGPLLDYSVNNGTSITSLLARRLAELFLSIGFRLGFHSFGTRISGVRISVLVLDSVVDDVAMIVDTRENL